MDLRQIRTFVAVADEGSVSRAAQVLRITQPALSRRIRDLEAAFGVTLFERGGRRLVLTGEGEEMLGHCRGVLGQATALRERARSLRAGEAGVLRVGVAPQWSENIFPDFLRRHRAAYPDVHVKLIEANHAQGLEMLERGELHLAMTLHLSDDRRFVGRPLPAIQILVAHTLSAELGDGATLEVEALAAVPLLLLKPGHYSRELLDAVCRLERVRPETFMESAAPHSLLALAEAGHGAAVLPASVPIARRPFRIAALLHRGERLQYVAAITWVRHRPLPRYAEDFVEALVTRVERAQPLSVPGGRPAVRG